jgi:hypothetical protein
VPAKIYIKALLELKERMLKMTEHKTNIFLSYSWADDEIANKIYSYFKDNFEIKLHKDKIEIGNWRSIKEYMQSIGDMDYTILIISDSYLKSENCMYEVLEVMRDRKYKNKIFPAVLSIEIYNPRERANYVKYWKNQFTELDEGLQEFEPYEMGKLGDDLKRRLDIKNSIAEFLDTIADMNNPQLAEVTMRIEEWLKTNGLLVSKKAKNDVKLTNDLFENYGITVKNLNKEPTEFELNQFVINSFNEIVGVLGVLCLQYKEKNPNVDIWTEKIDMQTLVLRLYSNGKQVRGIKIFIGSPWGSNETIGVSDNIMNFGSGSSWNEIYRAKSVGGLIIFTTTISLQNNTHSMSVKNVISDIWTNHIQTYL